MGTRHPQLAKGHIDFIARQKIFFVATATADSRVNVSPKGMDSFRVLGPNRVAWLNVTGSGNETAAHVRHDPRMTILFCAFDGPPLILRLYGAARAVHRNDAEWDDLLAQFDPLPGSRQIFDLAVDLVQTSCGMGVPNFAYRGDREALSEHWRRKGEEGLTRYWAEKNQLSIDRIPTRILERNC